MTELFRSVELMMTMMALPGFSRHLQRGSCGHPPAEMVSVHQYLGLFAANFRDLRVLPEVPNGISIRRPGERIRRLTKDKIAIAM
jgi:hypothetical protein